MFFLKSDLQNLKAELDAKEIEMNKVTDEANQMLTDAPSGSLQVGILF